MPRLTNKTYLQQRSLLVKVWQTDKFVFSILPYDDQLNIHGFYAPYMKLTDDEVIHHRRQVTADYPSLPQRAGKTFKKVSALIRSDGTRAYMRRSTPKSKERRVYTSALARPEPDIDKLAKVLLEVVRAGELR